MDHAYLPTTGHALAIAQLTKDSKRVGCVIESATIYAEKILPIWIDSRGISWETTGRLSRQRSSSEAWLSRFSDF